MTTKKPSGILVNFLTVAQFGDSSLGGISSRCKGATLILEEGGPFEPSDDYPGVVLLPGLGHNNPNLRAVPIELADGKRWTMSGGAWIYTSDGRFPARAPIALHDRVE